MDLPPDLLAERPNFDIDVTIRAIRKDVAFLTREKDHTARRGCAFVLIEQLNHLLESPATLPPHLGDGFVDDESGDNWLADNMLAGRGLEVLKTRPFANDAASGGFFIDFNGRLSSLFVNLPPDDGPFSGFPGPIVRVYRLDHTTPTLSSRHLRGSAGLARVAELVPERCEEDHHRGPRILIDPRGYARRRTAVADSLVLCAVSDASAAVLTADQLSDALHIRLVVATLVRFVDNH